MLQAFSLGFYVFKEFTFLTSGKFISYSISSEDPLG